LGFDDVLVNVDDVDEYWRMLMTLWFYRFFWSAGIGFKFIKNVYSVGLL